MKLHVRSVLAFTACTLAVAFWSGCEDSAARQREDVQAKLTAASRKLQQAMAGSGIGGLDDKTVASLNGIVSELGAVTGGEPGQQVAKSLLSATALRELAGMNQNEADRIEADCRSQRSVLQTKIDTALRLDAAATGIESFDSKASREALAHELELAKAKVNELSQKIAQLDGPIAEQTNQNATNTKEVEKLRLEVGELMRKAQEQGNVDGFDTYKHAKEVERQAAKIDYDVQRRQIDLQYTLTPEHEMASAQAAQLQAMAKAIEAAQAGLDAFAKAAHDDAAASRTKVQALTGEISETLAKIGGESSGPLKTAYDNAQAALEKAAAQAQSAKGDESSKLVLARIREAQGRLFWSQAMGLADQTAVLERLVNGGTTFDASKFADQLKAAGAAHDAALEQAKTSYASAQEALATVPARGDQTDLDQLKQNLEAASDVLSGKERAAEPAAAAQAAPAAAKAAAPPSRDGKFATAQELLDYLNSLPQSAESIQKALAVMHAESPNGKRLLNLQTELGKVFLTADQAIRAKFPQANAAEGAKGIPNLRVDLSAAKATQQTDDKVVYSAPPVMGFTNRTVFRLINGSWWIDLDELDPQVVTALPAMEAGLAALKEKLPSIVAQIKSGELKTPTEAYSAVGFEFGKGMGASIGNAARAGQPGKN